MKSAEELAAFWPKHLNAPLSAKLDFIRLVQDDALPKVEMNREGKACDYCGKPMMMWVGIKRTCLDEQCRKTASEQQKKGPLVNGPQMMEMIREEEARRDNES